LKLLAIVGSPRLKGNTNYLVDQALEEAEKLGAQTEKITLSQYKVNPCLGHDNYASLGILPAEGRHGLDSGQVL
jgi:multimeric flavodoxin WrbA